MAKHNIEAIARVCHEANRAYCVMIGDDPAPPWDEFGGENQQTTRMGVLHAIHGDSSPKAMHESWLAARTAQGWKYGETLDREKKIHPNLVPYDALSNEQRRKDRLFTAIIHVLTVRM